MGQEDEGARPEWPGDLQMVQNRSPQGKAHVLRRFLCSRVEAED